jgi:ribosomal protein L11 methyltransferase
MVSVEYFELRVLSGKNHQLNDLLVGLLAEIGFESFTDDASGFQAFIPSEQLDNSAMEEILQTHAKDIKFETNIIPPANWNALWESGFEPVEVNEKCVIRAPFHPPFNDGRLELIIEPRMSFGTGHHATTRLICRALFDTDLKGKTVMDMGCGTGVLGILAAKLGAAKVEGIDIESWATENAIENGTANGVEFHVETGNADLLKGRKFDIILANINRNVLVADISAYKASLNAEGIIFLSGFLTTDVELITKVYQKENFYLLNSSVEGDWNCLVFKL